MSTPAPDVVLLDVNETLSDMAPMAERFADVGLARHDAKLWFAEVLREGFALTVLGHNPAFADLAGEALRRRGLDPEAVASVMDGFGALDVHPDVVSGLRRLHASGVRVVTLSNGAPAVARGLLERAGVDDVVERYLTVADGPAWKPAAAAYATALQSCGVTAAEAMLVAVHPWDVAGAAHAGLRTAWVRRGAADYPSFHTAPEIEADDLVALAERLGA